jgi:RecA-family ATPase
MSDEKEFFTINELHDMELPETSFYLEPFIPTEGIVLMFGKPGSYKTTIANAMANAIVTGDPLWGITPNSTEPVLILELDTTTTAVKTRFVGGFRRDIGVHFYLYHGLIDFVSSVKSEQDIVRLSRLRTLHEEHKYKVVIIDTVSHTHVMEEKSPQTVTQVYSAAQRLFPGAVLIFLHHEKKTPNEQTEEMRLEAYSGSQQWGAQAQVVVMTRLLDKKLHKVSLEVTKSQVSEVPDESLRLQVDGWKVSLESQHRIDRVGEELAKIPAGTPKRQIDEILAKALGIQPITARIKRLEFERVSGLVTHGVVKPFLVTVDSNHDNPQQSERLKNG